MSRTKADWEVNVHHEIPNASVRTNGITVTCACGATGDVDFARNRLPPVAIRKKIIQQGWKLTGKKAICPTCQQKEPAPVTDRKPVTIADLPSENVATLPSVNQTPDARKAHRAVMGWLEEAYDEDAKRYRDGFSDQTIADETGASVQYVAKCREDYFGPLSMPSELEALTKALKALDDKLHESDKQARRAIQTVTDMHSKVMQTLRAEQQAIRDKINTLVVKNGWHQ